MAGAAACSPVPPAGAPPFGILNLGNVRVVKNLTFWAVTCSRTHTKCIPQAGGRQKSFLKDSSLCPHQQADEILCLILNCVSLTLQIWGWLAKLWFSGECGTSCLKARRVSSILRFPIGAPLKETCLWRGFISVREYYSSVMPIV